jgi:SAM-dependent methyltransferase
MSQTSSKPFGPIRDAYTFFQQHATETEADIRAYLPHVHDLLTGNSLIRMLDFGCGDGGFTAALLGRVCMPPERLRLALVEPDDVYRHQAVVRLQSCTTQPVCAWPALPSHLQACFDLVVVNHVLYYVPDLDGALSVLLRALATPGLFLAAMAGRANAMAQHGTEDVHYEVVFPDTDANRLSMGRFLLGDDFHAIPRRALVQCFDPYAHAGQIAMQPVHKHFIIRRHV